MNLVNAGFRYNQYGGNMSKIKLSDPIREKLIEELQDYFLRERDEILKHLGAYLMVDFIVDELGPMIYNQALLDAHKLMEDKIDDILLLELDDKYQYK